MIKTIIFDLGNVVVSFDHRKTSKRLADAFKHADDAVYEKAVASEIVREYNLGRLSTDEFIAAINREFGGQIGYEDFYAAWNCTFLPEPIISERLIERLSEKYKLLVLSDTNEMHFDFIRENYSMMKYFDDFVVSHKVNVVKPSAEIFQKAVELAECQPEECLFIDDLAANVDGAQKIGLQAIQFVSPEQLEADLKARKLL